MNTFPLKPMSAWYRRALLGIALSSLALSACATSQPIAGAKLAEREMNRQTLKLELETGKPEVVIGEPVYLTARLRNTGSAPVRVASYLELEGEAIQVKITREGGKTVPFVPLAIDDVDDPGQELPPGEAAAVVLSVFFGGRGWSFPEAGTYQITAVYQDFRSRSAPIESNPVTLQVRQDEASFFLTQGPASHETGKFLLWQSGDHLRRAQAQFQELLERYPESVLTDPVRLALGVSLSRSFKDYSIDRLRPPQFERALEYLRRVRPENLPPYLRLQKQLVEARCLVRLNRREEAEAVIAKARRQVLEQPELRQLYESEARLEPALPPLK